MTRTPTPSTLVGRPEPHAPRPGATARRLGAALAALACAVLPAHASEADDPLLSMLRDRGLLTAPAPSPDAADPAAPWDPSSELVLAAMNFLDVQYRLGGEDVHDGFDCSGFTRHVFVTATGLVLPRRAEAQAHAPALRAVGRDEIEPGDLVFFNTLRRAFSHVGLYIGDGRFVHAPRSGAFVRVESLRTRYWASRFDGARRLDGAGPRAAGAPPPAVATDGWTSPH